MADRLVFIKRVASLTTYILVYVDDMLICTSNADEFANVKSYLKEHFIINEMANIGTFLDIKIEYDKEKGTLSLNQTALIRKIAR